MTPKDIDEVLARGAAGISMPPDAAAADRAKRLIKASLRPVRPMASSPVLALRLLLVFLAVAAAGGAIMGMYGIRVLTPVARAVIFAVLVSGAAFAATAGSREMRPAGGRRISAFASIAGILVLLAVFALLFHDYGMLKFVRQGVGCLRAGLEFSLAAALFIYLLLRRGYIQNMAAAGLSAGTLAGLAGIGALELHCPILKAMHVMVWHLAVVVLSSALGFTVGWLLDVRRARQRNVREL